jgi:hypothetical protein
MTRDALIEMTTCPECGSPAEVRSRSVWESTVGPIEHIRIECVARHWFLMSVSSLASALSVPPAAFRRAA